VVLLHAAEHVAGFYVVDLNGARHEKQIPEGMLSVFVLQMTDIAWGSRAVGPVNDYINRPRRIMRFPVRNR
jgi:hypothetical protein